MVSTKGILNFAKNDLLKIKNIFENEGLNSRDVLVYYGRYLSDKGTKADLEVANAKFLELLKAAGFGAFLVLPGTVITLPAILLLCKKLGINILPKSFYEQFPKLKKVEK